MKQRDSKRMAKKLERHWRSGTTLLHNLLALDPQDALILKYFIDADGIIKEIQEGSFQSQTEIEDILDSL